MKPSFPAEPIPHRRSRRKSAHHQLCPRLLFGFSLCEVFSLLPFSPFSKTTGHKPPYRNRVKQRLLCGHNVWILSHYLLPPLPLDIIFGLAIGNEYTL